MRQAEWLRLLAALGALAVLFGCGSEKTQKPPDETPQLDLPFWQPRAFCLPAAATSDTLFITNYDDSAFVWKPTHAPAGASSNLSQTVTIQPGFTVGVLWTWNPPGSGAALDSLVVHTANPDVPRIVIPFRRVGANYVDTEPPAAPVLARPLDGATFQIGNEFHAVWSRVSDCSGIARYEIQIASDAGFHSLLSTGQAGVSSIRIGVEPGDEGAAYWRVRARDKAGLTGGWSEPRSWTVEPIGGAATP